MAVKVTSTTGGATVTFTQSDVTQASASAAQVAGASSPAVADSVLLMRSLGASAGFLIHDATTWRWYNFFIWSAVLVAALELVSRIAYGLGYLVTLGKPRIRIRGQHLDKLERIDYLYIAFGKITVTALPYHILQYTLPSPRVVGWKFEGHSFTFINTVVAVPLLYLVFDFFYTLFHRFLHYRWIYGFIHKHHHRQKAPSRGNSDAINVHPFELVVGEYIHLLAIYIVTQLISVHVFAILCFVLFGGFAASLNHTRFDVKFPIFSQVYQVKFHDIHHWYPDANFGQYTMFWDKLFGWFKPYPEEENAADKKRS